MMALDENMVVRNRRGKQVLAYDWRRLDPYLRAAHVLLILAVRNGNINRQETLHVVAEFYQCVVTSRYFAMNGDTDTRFEMRGELMVLGHAQRNSTFRQQDLAIRLDTRRVAHKAKFASQLLTSDLRQQHRDIALAAGRNTLVIEFADSDTTGILNGLEEVKATHGDSVQFILCDDLFEALVDSLSTLHSRVYFAKVST